MPPSPASPAPVLDTLLDLWRLSNRLTIYLIENLPDAIWPAKVPYPGVSHRTVRSIATHLHNGRCWWIGKNTGRKHGIAEPKQLDGRTATKRQVLAALPRSSRAMEKLIAWGNDPAGGSNRLPNFPFDMMHFVAYHAMHEAHHRGQLCTVARQLGHTLPLDVLGGLWQWKDRMREC